MTSRERVQAALARQPVDMVPLGFYCVDYPIIERVLGRPTFVRNRIKQQIGLWDGRRDEVAESLKVDTVEFYRKIDCADLIISFKEAGRLPGKDQVVEAPRRLSEDTWEDRQGRVYRASEISNDICIISDPNARKTEYTVEMFEKPAVDEPPDLSVYEASDYVIEQLGEDRYVLGPTAGLSVMPLLGGMERGLMRYASQPEVVQAAIDYTVRWMNLQDKYLMRAGAAGALIENDLAGTNGPMINPRQFRTMCFPALQSRVRSVKQHTPQVVMHSCGNNWPLMEMFIEAGIDGYQSMQTFAGMEVGALKEAYGDRLTFWGGVPVEVLVGGEPEQVRAAVREAMERGAPGGGFILGPSHSIAKGTSYENFMAMLDEFVKLRDKY